MYSTTKTGGGCRPKGINRPKLPENYYQPRLTPKEEAERALREAERHKELERLYAEHRKQQEEAAARYQAWEQKCKEFFSKPPAVGSVLNYIVDAVVHITVDPYTKKVSMYVLAIHHTLAFDDPAYVLARRGTRGLKIFLNGESRKRLIMDPKVNGNTLKVGGQVFMPLKVKIIGYARSGKAAHGAIVE